MFDRRTIVVLGVALVLAATLIPFGTVVACFFLLVALARPSLTSVRLRELHLPIIPTEAFRNPAHLRAPPIRLLAR